MFRLLVVLATVVCAVQCTNANAQGRSGAGYRGAGPGISIQAGRGMAQARSHAHGNHRHYRGSGSYRSHYPSSSFGFSIGIGGYPSYGYSGFGFFDPYRIDAYRTGTFRVPDLHDDPFFTEPHRYDSRFPGRYPSRYRAPLVVRPAVPAVNYEPYGSATAFADEAAAQLAPVHPSDLAGQLRSSCQQLSRSLSTRQDGESWIEYLAPHKISQLIATGNTVALRELLTHYDGVVGNPQLRPIAATGGFGTTRSLLRQYVNQPAESTEPLADEPTIESLPAPEPEAVPDSLPESVIWGERT